MTQAESPAISVIIPALNESEALPKLLADLARLELPAVEIIVADGGSNDGTADVVVTHGALLVRTARGRGHQLRAAALVAHSNLLCFLHADVRLEAPALRALEQLATQGQASPAAYAFRLRIHGTGISFRVVERLANLRSRLFALPYGDQGLIITRQCYDDAGGFADVPLMEDVMFVRALHKRRVPIVMRPESITVSARRWERDGVWRRSVRNLWLLARWALGATPEHLANSYERGNN